MYPAQGKQTLPLTIQFPLAFKQETGQSGYFFLRWQFDDRGSTRPFTDRLRKPGLHFNIFWKRKQIFEAPNEVVPQLLPLFRIQNQHFGSRSLFILIRQSGLSGLIFNHLGSFIALCHETLRFSETGKLQKALFFP
jgi:hypothetical protein